MKSCLREGIGRAGRALLPLRTAGAAAAAELLARAVETAPTELSLPDGRRMRPTVQEPRPRPSPPPGSWWRSKTHPGRPRNRQPRARAQARRPPATTTWSPPRPATTRPCSRPSPSRAPLEKGGARGFAELRPITPQQEMLMAPEEAEALAQRMWRQREELSDLDTDVLDAISAAWLRRGPRAASERVSIYVNDLLRSRGLKPKRGGFEPEQRADLWRCLLHLQDIWLDIAEVTVVDHDARGRRTQRTRSLQSRAFVMTDLIGQRRLDGTMDVEAILVTPGEARRPT